MLDYKLIKLLQVLTVKEMSDIEKLLGTPFFNATPDVCKLFLLLNKFYPDFDSPNLTKELLFAGLYRKKGYNDGKMRKLMTQLTQLIEQFLISKELGNSEDIQAKLLARSLAGRQNYDLFLDVVETRLKELDKGVERGRDYFREGYELSEMLYYHPGSGKLSRRGEYYDKAISNFERYFTLVMLQNEADNIVKSRIVSGKKSSAYIDFVLSATEFEKFDSISAVHFFKHIIMLLKGQAEENIAQLQYNAFSTLRVLSRFEQDFAINLLRNYAAPKSNSRSLPHRKFVLELYKEELSRGFFANTIGSASFMNIVTIAISIEDFEWANTFISDYEKLLAEDEREITLNYCMGLWHYHKSLINESIEGLYLALQFFNRIPLRTGPKYELRTRPYVLRIYFELLEKNNENLDDVLNHARNFERHLIGSAEYSESIKKAYLLFVRKYKSLARLISIVENRKSKAIEFIDKIESEKSEIAHKMWFIEKGSRLANHG